MLLTTKKAASVQPRPSRRCLGHDACDSKSALSHSFLGRRPRRNPLPPPARARRRWLNSDGARSRTRIHKRIVMPQRAPGSPRGSEKPSETGGSPLSPRLTGRHGVREVRHSHPAVRASRRTAGVSCPRRWLLPRPRALRQDPISPLACGLGRCAHRSLCSTLATTRRESPSATEPGLPLPPAHRSGFSHVGVDRSISVAHRRACTAAEGKKSAASGCSTWRSLASPERLTVSPGTTARNWRGRGVTTSSTRSAPGANDAGG